MDNTLKHADSNPQVVVSARAVARLRGGHLWVYRSDLEQAHDATPGALVTVTDRRGKPFGTGLYSSASQIAVRLLARDGIASAQLLPLIRQRILDALAFRAPERSRQ